MKGKLQYLGQRGVAELSYKNGKQTLGDVSAALPEGNIILELEPNCLDIEMTRVGSSWFSFSSFFKRKTVLFGPDFYFNGRHMISPSS